MLQVILKFDQNWKQSGHQNRLKFDQKSIKQWHRIQSWFWNQYFFDSWTMFDLFWINFGAFLNPKSLQNRFQSGFGSVPDPQVASKGRLDPTWNRSGSILGAFLTSFFKNFDKFLINFSIKAIQKVQFGQPTEQHKEPRVLFAWATDRLGGMREA